MREIAEEIEANEHTTGKILQLLVKAGIICSSKGPGGGFYIEEGKKPVYLIDIRRWKYYFLMVSLQLAKEVK